MARSEGFYMTLPSDGSIQFFPDNKLSDYKTLLPNQLNLDDGEWEVALTEMMYGTDVQNISDKEAYFDILITKEYSDHLGDPNLFKNQSFTKD